MGNALAATTAGSLAPGLVVATIALGLFAAASWGAEHREFAIADRLLAGQVVWWKVVAGVGGTLAITVATVMLIGATHPSSAAGPAADRPDVPAAFPHAVSGLASAVPPTVGASSSPTSAAADLSRLQPAGGEGRQGVPEQITGDDGSRDVVSASAPAGSSVPAHEGEIVEPGRGDGSDSHPAVPLPPWDELAECESHGEWDYDPATATWGNRLFEGGLQFLPATWDGFKPDGFPDHAHEASRAEQIVVAERVLDAQGWGAWPTCARKLGLL